MMIKSLSEHFRAEVEAFLQRTRMKSREFGELAVKDPGFLLDLRRGRSCTLATADRVLQFIRSVENKT